MRATQRLWVAVLVCVLAACSGLTADVDPDAGSTQAVPPSPIEDDAGQEAAVATPTTGPATSAPDIPVIGAEPSDSPAADCEQGMLLAIGTGDHDSSTLLDWFNAAMGPDSPGGYQVGVAGAAHWAGGDYQGLLDSLPQIGLVGTSEATAALEQAAADGVALLQLLIAVPGTSRNPTGVQQYDAVIAHVAASELFREVIVHPCPAA